MQQGDDTGNNGLSLRQRTLRQRQRTLATKNEDNGPDHDHRLEFDLKWTLVDSVCDWPGVTCQGGNNDLVTTINVSQALLHGTIPREITVGAALPQLTVLDLSHNQLQGYLPYGGTLRTHASELKIEPPSNALQQVYLQHNQIKGTLDPLMDWPSLSRFTFTSCGYILIF
jgi:hypothetical protein